MAAHTFCPLMVSDSQFPFKFGEETELGVDAASERAIIEDGRKR